MQRVVVLGRGGAGKSTLATRLGGITSLPVIDLDGYFWRPGLTPTPLLEWVEMQRQLAQQPEWIMDGDLGPYDSLGPRLAAADTVLVLDFSLWRCAWHAVRRSPERADFWWWVFLWRWRSRPVLMRAIAEHAPQADVRVFRAPTDLKKWLGQLTRR